MKKSDIGMAIRAIIMFVVLLLVFVVAWKFYPHTQPEFVRFMMACGIVIGASISWFITAWYFTSKIEKGGK